MADLRHFQAKQAGLSSDRRWLTAAAMALVLGLIGAYGFASQEAPKAKNAALSQSAVIRTTPDAPREVPPPVQQVSDDAPQDAAHAEAR